MAAFNFKLSVTDGVDVAGQVEHLAAEAPLVIVPCHELYEVVVKSKAGLCVENAGVRIGDEVGGYDLILAVLDNALHGALCRCLDCRADLVVARALLKAAGQVNDGHVAGGDTHGSAGQLALELGDDLADCLCGAGAGGDDVAVNTAAETPVLLAEAVNNFLSCGVGVNGGHETFDDTEVIVYDLCKRSKAVGGAGGVGDDLHVGGVLIEVYAADEHRGVVLGGTGENDDLCAGVEVCLCLLSGEESAGAFEDVLNAHLAPGQLRGVAVADYCDALAVYGDGVVVILDGAVEAAMYGVVLDGVCKLCGGLVRSVYCDDLDIVGNDARSERQTADASEAIDCNFDHFIFLHLVNYLEIITGDLIQL